MYDLIFIILVITKTGVPGFNIEHVSKFKSLGDCEKAKVTMQEYVDKLVESNRTFPGVFDCRKSL